MDLKWRVFVDQTSRVRIYAQIPGCIVDARGGEHDRQDQDDFRPTAHKTNPPNEKIQETFAHAFVIGCRHPYILVARQLRLTNQGKPELKKVGQCFALILCVATALGSAFAIAEQSPDVVQNSGAPESLVARQTVEQFHHSVLDMLKRADALGYEGRVGELRPVVDTAMDIKMFGARTVGSAAWNGWTAEQRQNFLATYKEYVCATYAARFSGFSGQEFVTVGSRPGRRGQIVIETEVRQPDDSPIRLDYVMRDGRDSWGIVDIYLDSAISEVALRRSEFSAVLKREGYDGLIAALHSKIEERAAEN